MSRLWLQQFALYFDAVGNLRGRDHDEGRCYNLPSNGNHSMFNQSFCFAAADFEFDWLSQEFGKPGGFIVSDDGGSGGKISWTESQ